MEVTLNIPTPHFNPELPESLGNIKQFSITNGKLIREEAIHSFQKIFDHQDNLNTDEEDIVSFLNSDGDTLLMETLTKRKLTRAEAMEIEGLLTMEELTTAFFQTHERAIQSRH